MLAPLATWKDLGRTIKPGTRIRVYRNLHTGGFSIMDAKTNRVVVRTDGVLLSNVSFVVRPAGREKVLREKRKTVHAFAVGFVALGEDPNKIRRRKAVVPISYNPYRSDKFVVKIDGREEPVSNADWVWLGPYASWACGWK